VNLSCLNLFINYFSSHQKNLSDQLLYLFIFIIFSVSPCDSVTCENEGTCVVEAGLALCVCQGDYSGSTCAGNHFILFITYLTLNTSTYRKKGEILKHILYNLSFIESFTVIKYLIQFQ
jgi:hypothetical protein